MPLRTRIFIVISIVVLVILAISIFLYISNKNKIDTTTTPTTTTQIPGGSNIPNNLLDSSGQVDTTKVQIQQPTSQEVDKNASKQLAKIFIERFGSYSSDSNYQNIQDVKELVTTNLWSTLSAMISNDVSNQAYSGVTTKVIAVTNNNWSTTSADYTLSTIRETSQNGSTTTTNQDVQITLNKVNGNWLVNSYQWK